jgi:hypothetical protein
LPPTGPVHTKTKSAKNAASPKPAAGISKKTNLARRAAKTQSFLGFSWRLCGFARELLVFLIQSTFARYSICRFKVHF